jgi:hypothetical protein
MHLVKQQSSEKKVGSGNIGTSKLVKFDQYTSRPTVSTIQLLNFTGKENNLLEEIIPGTLTGPLSKLLMFTGPKII